MRAQLYSVNRLPPAADEAVRWVIEEVRIARLTQGQMCDGLNERLRALGIPPISPSAFQRWFAAGLEYGFPNRGPALPQIAEKPSSTSAPCCPSCGARLALTITVALRTSSNERA